MYPLRNGDVKVVMKGGTTIWLITLGQVNQWFHRKLSPLYRERITRELDLWLKEDYVLAWRNALNGLKGYIGYYGDHPYLPGVDEGYFIEEYIRYEFYCGGMKRTVAGDTDLFSETSCIPMLIFNAIALKVRRVCDECYDDGIDAGRVYPKCKCDWEPVVNNARFLTLITCYTKKLLREGWSWDYSRKRLTLYKPVECKECGLSTCNGCVDI